MSSFGASDKTYYFRTVTIDTPSDRYTAWHAMTAAMTQHQIQDAWLCLISPRSDTSGPATILEVGYYGPTEEHPWPLIDADYYADHVRPWLRVNYLHFMPHLKWVRLRDLKAPYKVDFSKKIYVSGLCLPIMCRHIRPVSSFIELRRRYGFVIPERQNNLRVQLREALSQLRPFVEQLKNPEVSSRQQRLLDEIIRDLAD